MALDMYKNAKGTGDEKKALDNLEKVSKETLGVKLPLPEITFDGTDYSDKDFTERKKNIYASFRRL
jgi:hypothetical protein